MTAEFPDPDPSTGDGSDFAETEDNDGAPGAVAEARERA